MVLWRSVALCCFGLHFIASCHVVVVVVMVVVVGGCCGSFGCCGCGCCGCCGCFGGVVVVVTIVLVVVMVLVVAVPFVFAVLFCGFRVVMVFFLLELKRCKSHDLRGCCEQSCSIWSCVDVASMY